jgi:hypothetical protein
MKRWLRAALETSLWAAHWLLVIGAYAMLAGYFSVIASNGITQMARAFQ